MSRRFRWAALFAAALLTLGACATTVQGEGSFESGSNLVVVPKVTGLTAAAAAAKLGQLGLIAEFSGDSKALVITQSPVAMEEVEKGASVTLGLDSPFIVKGAIVVTSYDGKSLKTGAGGSCTGTDQYADIVSGAKVSLITKSGKTVAQSTLGAGTGTSSSCRFPFTIADVPADQTYYSLRFANRNGPRYSKSALAKEIVVTVGY